jgi:hypothetical protein
MADDIRGRTGRTEAPCATPECEYEDTAYSLDPDGLCLNCSDDRERDRRELESELRQDAAA